MKSLNNNRLKSVCNKIEHNTSYRKQINTSRNTNNVLDNKGNTSIKDTNNILEDNSKDVRYHRYHRYYKNYIKL